MEQILTALGRFIHSLLHGSSSERLLIAMALLFGILVAIWAILVAGQ
jgi:hypothetical protein